MAPTMRRTTGENENNNKPLDTTHEGVSSSSPISLPTRMVLSAFAGMGAATICHPLDVVRVQMQTFHYSSTIQATTSIYQKSGFTNGLYAGISAAYLRQWLYGSCRMGIYSYLLEKQKLEGRDISFVTKLGMGCISGGIGSFVGTPSEIALVRMSADSKLPVSERRNYTNVLNCLFRISKEEGFVNLWRGAAPTVVRATLLSSCQMGVTSQTKDYLSNNTAWFGPKGQWLGGLPMMFCATLCSSFCANIVATPFDVIKSRMQQMPFVDGVAPLYSSMSDCFVKSIRAEGITVLWAGFIPAFVKLAPYTLISLTLIDKLTKAVTGKDAL